ncbi:hypothetical protein [Trichormus sp. NMC-1]|uniref:hypothetical protein n=1 Tax=Trichormus sp. NMC-1 TaxID=1853259 RepID=UPI000B267A6E|nr:hypothetical protein [Trichormus sp. NMC-1]
MIPRGSAAYRDAQEQIRTWRQFILPEPSPELSSEPSPRIEQSQPSPTSDGL